ncbi:hypothetical protein ES703_118069 [subsurface metagenome]
MVLYVEALKANCRDYLCLAAVAARVLDGDVLLSGQLGDSVRTCHANLVVLEGLLAAGITELEVPQKK